MSQTYKSILDKNWDPALTTRCRLGPQSRVLTTLQRDENDFSHSTTRLPPSLATGLNVKVTNATAGFTMDRTHTLTTFIALIHLGTSSSHSSSREQMLFVL